MTTVMAGKKTKKNVLKQQKKNTAVKKRFYITSITVDYLLARDNP